MLAKPLAFEQDKNAIFLRNQEMHLHFSKLDSIRQRKNTYLPDITNTKYLLRIKKIIRLLQYYEINNISYKEIIN